MVCETVYCRHEAYRTLTTRVKGELVSKGYCEDCFGRRMAKAMGRGEYAVGNGIPKRSAEAAA